MSSRLPFMPLYNGDYRNDTVGFNAEEHGAYLLLIMAAWDAGGPLPNDPTRLARIACVTRQRWPTVARTVMAKFTVVGDEIRNKRVERELANAQARYEAKAAAGRKGGRPKKEAQDSLDLDPGDGGNSSSQTPFDDDTVKGGLDERKALESNETKKAQLSVSFSDSRARVASHLTSVHSDRPPDGPSRGKAEGPVAGANLQGLDSPSGEAKPEMVLPSSVDPPSPSRREGGLSGRPPGDEPTVSAEPFRYDGRPMVSKEQAAANAAMRRLDAALVAAGREFHTRVIDREDVYAAAVEVEIAHPGAGLQQCIVMLDDDAPFKFVICGEAPGRVRAEPEITWVLQ